MLLPRWLQQLVQRWSLRSGKRRRRAGRMSAPMRHQVRFRLESLEEVDRVAAELGGEQTLFHLKGSIMMKFLRKRFFGRTKPINRSQPARLMLEEFEARNLLNAGPLFSGLDPFALGSPADFGSPIADPSGPLSQQYGAGQAQSQTLVASLTGASGTSGTAIFLSNSTTGVTTSRYSYRGWPLARRVGEAEKGAARLRDPSPSVGENGMGARKARAAVESVSTKARRRIWLAFSRP